MNAAHLSQGQGCLTSCHKGIAAFRPCPRPGLVARRAIADPQNQTNGHSPSSTVPPLQYSTAASNLPWEPHADALPLPLVSGAGAYLSAVDAGAKKALQPARQTFRMALLTGGYVGLGCLLMLSVGGNAPALAAANPGLAKIITGLVGLPSALIIILVAGGDLYTGNTALLTAAAIEGRASLRQVARGLLCSYVGNFLGCFAMAALVHSSGLLATAAAPKAIAVMKTSLPLHQVWARAVMGNWLVCLAVYLATACTTMGGKVLAAFLCIPAFVAIGLEHCIANHFLITMGIFCGADVTWGQFFLNNLLPVTLGNTFAGMVLVAGAYSCIYGKLSRPTRPHHKAHIRHLAY